VQISAKELRHLANADVFPGGRGFYPGDNPLTDIEGAVLSA
jgi:hypothetical protein